MPTTPHDDARRYRTSVVFVLALLAAYLVVALRWQGLSFYDDTMYLYFGTHFSLRQFADNLAASPLYAAWFAALGLVVHNAISRYFVSWALLVLAIGTIPLLFRLRSAWIFTLALVCIPFFSTATYIAFFAAAILVAAVAWLLRQARSFAATMFACTVTCFFVTYCRPEFSYATFIAAALATVALLRERQPRAIVKTLACVLFCTAILWSMIHSSTGRSGYAFAQHYNYRAVLSGVLREDPWSSDYAYRVFGLQAPHGSYGEATVGDFFHANPHLFLEHLRRNLTDAHTLGLLLIIAIVVLLPWSKPALRPWRNASVFVAISSIPVISSSVIIFPRPHYAVIVLPVLLLLALQMLVHVPLPATRTLFGLFLAACVLMLLESRLYNRHRRSFDSVGRANISLVRCLADLEAQQSPGTAPVIDTVTLAGVDAYLPAPLHRVAPETPRPRWIILGPNTPYAQAGTLRSEAGAAGYTLHPCPTGTHVEVWTSPTR